jgi:cytochrome c biogenesis protein CcmG/thiol:disulfide interchange protein DsbE
VTACSLVHPLTGTDESLASIGKAAPDFSGVDLDGRAIRLSDYKGHPVMLNFWASWCGPCRREQPALLAVASTYTPRGLVIIGINVRDNLEQARIYRDDFHVPYPSLYDQAARLGYSYQVDAPPGSVFIDKAGVVRFKITGSLGEDSFRRIIQDKLGSSLN